MQRAYVILIGLLMLLISYFIGERVPLGSFIIIILAGFFIARFSKREEEAVNMIITATIFLLIGLSVKLMMHNIPLSAWTLLLVIGGFFGTLILMTIGSIINKVISRRKLKPKEDLTS